MYAYLSVVVIVVSTDTFSCPFQVDQLVHDLTVKRENWGWEPGQGCVNISFLPLVELCGMCNI